ncbi:MAG: hypothetical protein IKI11_10595 [Neisseriaceae bacterium]|nr:hypothetical protein [Neisseriaceae bacterium]
MCIAFVFRRLPRRAFGTARNDDRGFSGSLKEKSKRYLNITCFAARQNETTAHYSLLTANCKNALGMALTFCCV